MDEQQWLMSSDLRPLLYHLEQHGESAGRAGVDRKFRLFAVACCRRIWHSLSGDGEREAVLLSERYADGQCSAKALETARHMIIDEGHGLSAAALTANLAAKGASQLDPGRAANDAAWYAAQAAGYECGLPDEPVAEPGPSAGQRSGYDAAFAAEQEAQAGLLREIFGPLSFRSVPIAPEWLSWHGGLVPSMARRIYDARAVEGLPILADCLEEAGCVNAELLTHCRQPVGHPRGCWVVDLLLGHI
jgi:hypothetical protein